MRAAQIPATRCRARHTSGQSRKAPSSRSRGGSANFSRRACCSKGLSGLQSRRVAAIPCYCPGARLCGRRRLAAPESRRHSIPPWIELRVEGPRSAGLPAARRVAAPYGQTRGEAGCAGRRLGRVPVPAKHHVGTDRIRLARRPRAPIQQPARPPAIAHDRDRHRGGLRTARASMAEGRAGLPVALRARSAARARSGRVPELRGAIDAIHCRSLRSIARPRVLPGCRGGRP